MTGDGNGRENWTCVRILKLKTFEEMWVHLTEFRPKLRTFSILVELADDRPEREIDHEQLRSISVSTC